MSKSVCFQAIHTRLLTCGIISLTMCGQLAADPIQINAVQRSEPVLFEKDILPILQRSCLACHSASARQGDLVLETPDAMRKGGDAGPAILPGRGAESLLLKVAAHQDEPVMPPAGNDVNARPLTPDELGLLRLWIDQGARGAGGLVILSPRQSLPLPGHLSPVHAVALTLDGQYLAAARANQLFLYHVATGRLVTRLTDPALQSADAGPEKLPGIAHHDLVESLAFNVDGDLLASGGFREAKLWRRPGDVQMLNLAAGGPVTAVAVSVDQQWIATTAQNHSLRLWNASTGQPGPVMAGHTDRITSLRFSPDGTRLISASLDQTIRLWNTADGSPTGVIETPVAVNAVELVRSSGPTEALPEPPSVLVSGGTENFIRTWTLPDSAPRHIDQSLSGLQQLSVSNDGAFAAMIGGDGLVRILQSAPEAAGSPALGRIVAEWKPDAPPVTTLAFVSASVLPSEADAPAVTPGSDVSHYVLATGSGDGTITLWSLPDHQPLARWRGGTNPVTALTASMDGRQMMTGAENGTLSHWKLDTSSIRGLDGTTGTPVTVLAISPSRKLAAVAGLANGQPAIQIRNLDNGQVTHTLTGHSAAVRSLAFSMDSARVVSGSDDHTVRVWNPGDAAQPEQARLEGHAAAVTGVAFSPDGSQVLSGAVDHAVRLWNLADGTALKDFAGHAGPVIAVGFAPGNVPYSVSNDRTVRFWNPVDGSQTRAFNDQAGTVAFTLRPDGQKMALAGDDRAIRIYQSDNGQLLQTLAGHTLVPGSLSFSADGKRLVSSAFASDSPAGEAIVWDVESNPPRLLEWLPGASTVAAFTEQSDHLLHGDRNGRLTVSPLRFMRHLDGNQQAITSLLFHSSGQTAFVATRDGSLRGYSTANGQQTFATGHGAAIHGMALSPNEQVLATAGENGIVRLWQTNGGGFGPQQLTGFPGPVHSVAFSADSTKVLAGSAGEKPAVLVFDLTSGTLQQRFSSHTQPVRFVSTIRTSAAMPDVATPASGGSAVISAGADGVWQWSVHAVRHIPGHGNAVTSLAAVPDTSMQVFSGSTDTTVRRWNLDNGQQLGQYNHGGAVLGIAVRPDGQRLASVSDNHTARLWNVNGQQIAEMRGDIRQKTLVARLSQQQNAAQGRVNIAKQQLDQAEKDVPVKTEAEKKAAEALAAANKEITDKQAALKKALDEKVAVEKAAIEASAVARNALLARTQAETAASSAAAAIPLLQQKAAQLAAAAGTAAADEALKKAAADAQQAVQTAQQTAQQLQQAIQAPTQAFQMAVNAANEAAQKVNQAQKPYNDALAALKTSESAQNLTAQQHVIAARELDVAQKLVPVVQQTLQTTEAALEDAKKRLEEASKASADADLAIRTAAFSPDGSVLVTAGEFSSVHTWDAETGTALAAFAGHTGPVHGVAFSGDGLLVSGSEDQTARVWELNPAWRLERTIGAADHPEIISDRVMSLDFAADSSSLLVAGGIPSRNGELHLFNVADGQRTLFLPQAHDDVVYAARFSPDGKRIASAGADKYLKTFDVASAQQLRRFEGHTSYVLDVAWKGDGQILVSSGADRAIKVWEAETGDQQRTIENFGKHVTAVTYIGETDNIVSSCGDRLVRMHNAANGGNFRNFNGPSAWLHCVDITPGGDVLCTGTAQGLVYLWNGNNGQPLKTLTIGE